MILVSVDIDAFFVALYLSYSLTTTQLLNLGNIKNTSDVVFVRSFLDTVLDQYVRGGVEEETDAKNIESFHRR